MSLLFEGRWLILLSIVVSFTSVLNSSPPRHTSTEPILLSLANPPQRHARRDLPQGPRTSPFRHPLSTPPFRVLACARS